MAVDSLSVLLVGSGSLLGRAVMAVPPGDLAITAVTHDQFEPAMAKSYDVIVNMAYDPRYMREAYDPALDFDRKVAEAVAGGRGHFVMLSSRRVYGPGHKGPIAEDAPTCPADTYGRNKLYTEELVRALLGSRCTVLRLGNVFGFETGRHTFLGIALENLKRNDRIVLDANPFVAKDFIPLPDCTAALLSIIRAKPAGTFNLGYGTATETGRIALWLIEGYGRGELAVTSAEERDGFLLDIGALKARGLLPEHQISIRDYCVGIGEQLRNA